MTEQESKTGPTYTQNPYGAGTVTVTLAPSDDAEAVLGTQLAFTLAQGYIYFTSAKDSGTSKLFGYTVKSAGDEASVDLLASVTKGKLAAGDTATAGSANGGNKFDIVADSE